MEVMMVLLGIVVIIGLPVMAIGGFVMGLKGRTRIAELEAALARLSGRTDVLASDVAALGSGALTQQQPQARPSETLRDILEETPQPEAASQAAPVPPEIPAAEEIPIAASEQQPAPPPVPPRPRRDLESMIGGRWSVILGGFATAFGAILLVRATIEAGLLGPAARIVLAALFSAALFAAGEVLRRRDRQLSLPVFPTADVPAILTAAGAVAAFSTVYAAYALYGFIGPAAAFLALTIVGLASLALSAVHGPGLAALGVVGSYATPLLVSSDEPNLYALAAHVLVVTASTLGIAVVRGWLWLAFAGVAGSIVWIALAALSPDAGAGLAGLVMMAGAGLLFAGAFGRYAHGNPQPPVDDPVDRAGIFPFAALAAAFFFQAAANQWLPGMGAGIVVSLIIAGTAVLWPALAPAAIAAAVIAVVAVAALDLNLAFNPGLDRPMDVLTGMVPPDTAAYVRSAIFVAAPAALVLLWGAWRAASNAARAAGWLASGTGLIAFLCLVVAYLRVAPFQTDRLFGAVALALAFGFAALVEMFTRQRPGDMQAPAPAAFAVASIAALSFAFAVTLDTGWLPLAFALAAAGIAWVHGNRPLSILPVLAFLAALIGAANLWFSLPFDPATIGTTYFFNKLILLAGLPALALVGAGEYMRRNGSNLPAAGTTALGLGLSGLFVALEIRHWLSGGVIDTYPPELAETATDALAALGFSIGLQRVATMTGARVYSIATAVAGVISALLIAGGLLVVNNPLIDAPDMSDGLVFNLLLPAYLLPAIAAGLVAMQARAVRPRWYTLTFAALAGLLLFIWLTLTIRHAWKGDQMEIWHSASEAEVWTYSAAWLALGVALLAIGHLLRSQAIRAASGILIALTVTKVFLIDMSALTGAMRAFSFIGLGLSLLAIGRFYQRILLSGRAGPPPAQQPPQTPPPLAPEDGAPPAQAQPGPA